MLVGYKGMKESQLGGGLYSIEKANHVAKTG